MYCLPPTLRLGKNVRSSLRARHQCSTGPLITRACWAARAVCPGVVRSAVVDGPGFVSPFGLCYAGAGFVLCCAANEAWWSQGDSNP